MIAYWIESPWPGRLAIVPRPRGGDWTHDEVAAWKSEAVDGVVSLLTERETIELQLQGLNEACDAQNIQYVSLPIEDRGTPLSVQEFVEALVPIEHGLSAGRTYVAFCRQGLGRAPLTAACLLVLGGVHSQKAFRSIAETRRCHVPETSAQEDWVRKFESDSLARRA